MVYSKSYKMASRRDKKTFIEAINFSCHVNWFLVTSRINGGTETDESPQASGKEI